jgi:hypothetical protein
MRHDELDRILSEDEILPSSGFLARVMDTVHSESSTPPIPFPWMRALPGLAAAAVALLTVVVYLSSERVTAAPAFPADWHFLDPSAQSASVLGAGWILSALLLTLGSTLLSMRIAGSDA